MATRLQFPLRARSNTQALSGNTHRPAQGIYDSLMKPAPAADALEAARHYLDARLDEARHLPCDLPAAPQALDDWMRSRHREVGDRFAEYLCQRREGAARRYFSSRAHALYFLRGVAPTKLADGSWLHGLVHCWHDARLHGLIQTYLDELGNGRPQGNHVLLYQSLLAEEGCEHWRPQADQRYRQGAIQLALGWHAARFLPEVIGFNLGYEQLPLHLLITVHELDELGIDPHYFRLHVTVDNPSSGHARKAVDAVTAAWPSLIDGRAFYRRVRDGYRLNALGESSERIIAAFDPWQELLRIVADKGSFGRHMHADRCRIGERSVNDWLRNPDHAGAFLLALRNEGWIEHHADPKRSRFWRLIEGDRALMSGVFDPYERQVFRDWITQQGTGTGTARTSPLRARHQQRSARQRTMPSWWAEPGNPHGSDDELRQLQQRLMDSPSRASAMALLAGLMSPATHIGPAGLMATRIYSRVLHSVERPHPG